MNRASRSGAPPRVYWTGWFFNPSSLAIVNRRLVQAIVDRGNIDVAIGSEAVAPELLPETFHALTDRRMLFGAHEADVVVAHSWPPRFAAPKRPRYVHVQPWEYGSMPSAWYEALHDDCDDLWSHSAYNRQLYLEAGMPAERVTIVPHGVDPTIFRREGPRFATNDANFRFLFVGGTLSRKGIDVLVNAYFQAFSARDAVTLVVKDVNPNTLYRGQTHADQLRELTKRRGLARFEYVEGMMPDEPMAEFYRACDCLVLPYRGEGFGLPVLEAMACGLPVIVTADGSTDDFVDEGVGWRIRSQRRELAPGAAPLPTVGTAWILEPDVESLIATMRYAYEHRDEVQHRGAAAADRVARTWTWDRAAAIAESRLMEIANREPIPPKRRTQRYADFHPYLERVFGSSDADGILLELFIRLGIASPSFVEITEGAQDASAPTLARGLHWRGLALEFDPSAAERVRERYGDAPHVRYLFGEVTPAAVAGLLRPNRIEADFDLLAIHCRSALAIWEALAGFRPRVVVCDRQAAGDLETASRLGYEPIASDGSGRIAIFARQDLVERAGFRLEVAHGR